MTNWKEYTAHSIKRLRGPHSDNAYHILIEADDVIIPILWMHFGLIKTLPFDPSS